MTQVRSAAPSFSLPALVGTEVQTVSLSDYAGKWVVLAWYPKDQTAVCQSELQQFSTLDGDLTARNAVLLGASTQGLDTKKAWVADELGEINVPLLADEGGAVAKSYGILLDLGISLRSTFIIDPEGVLRWCCDHDLPIGRSSDEILRVLDALQSGGACLVNWRKE